MSSIKLTELDLEAKLKDQILSHARAVYGSAHPTGTFDLVFEKESKMLPDAAYRLVAYKTHLIVYESPNSHANWTLILSVQRRQTIAEGMSVLLEILREKMTAVMAVKITPNTEREGYNQTYDPFCARPQFMNGFPTATTGAPAAFPISGTAMDFAMNGASMGFPPSGPTSWDPRSNQPSPQPKGGRPLLFD